MNWSFVSALITASIIGAWNVPLGAEAAVYGMAFGGCIVLCNSTAGAAVLQLFRIPQQARFYSLAFILGNVVVSVLLFAGAYLLSAPRILLAGGILLAAGAAAGRKGLRSVFPRSTPFEAAAVAVTAVAATLWSDTALFPLFELGQQTVLRPWIDIYIHAANLTIFKSGVAAKDFGAIYLAGTPLSFYHFASYQVGVLHGVFTGATALQTTAGMLTPYGVLCAGIAVFALFSACVAPLWDRCFRPEDCGAGEVCSNGGDPAQQGLCLPPAGTTGSSAGAESSGSSGASTGPTGTSGTSGGGTGTGTTGTGTSDSSGTSHSSGTG